MGSHRRDGPSLRNSCAAQSTSRKGDCNLAKPKITSSVSFKQQDISIVLRCFLVWLSFDASMQQQKKHHNQAGKTLTNLKGHLQKGSIA